jgi:ABC-2 type transport system ATP-binding protein
VSDRPVIETAGLWKRYDDVEALRGLDLHVPTGSICGFLGRNGAGKTTTIKILLGMSRPTQGDARVFGLSPFDPQPGVEIRSRTAFVSDEKDLYDYMTVAEIVAFTRSFYPKWRDDLEQQYLRKFDLAPGRVVKGLSRGTRTKVALLVALCRGAELLVLDEPTAGLDPAMAEEVLQALVSHVASESSTVFFRAKYQRIHLVFEGNAPEFKVHAPGTHRLKRKGRVITILSSNGGTAILEELRGYGPASIDVSPVTLKDIFLESVRTED